MIKRLLTLFILLNMFAGLWAQVVTTASDVTVCTGATTVDIPVKVSSFTAVGSVSLKFSYVNTEITSPSVIYTDPGLDAWGTFQVHTATAGTIIISAFDPDFTEPTGLTLANNTTLFTIQFTIGTITTPAEINFTDNPLGTWLEYGGVGPNYTPFYDTPQETHYIDGSVTVVPDPSWTAYSFPTTSICNGGSVTFSVNVVDGLGGTISWTRSSTPGGSGTAVTSPDSPGTGTWYFRPQYTPTGEGCNLADGTETMVTVSADPSWTAYSFPTTSICNGGSVTFSVNVVDGLGGTISWTRSSTPGGSGTAVTSPDLPGTGTWYFRPQYTPTGEGCNLADGTETTVTVYADPVAPGLTKNPDATSVCEGDALTVSITSGSGGAGTITDEYQYSTNNGVSWSGWSTTVPNFASVSGTNIVQSRRTATGTGCDVSSVNQVSWVVNARQKISGTIYYHKSSGDILMTEQDITLQLYKSIDESHTNLIASAVSDASGNYEFPNLCPDCDYDIVATSTHATDYAINTTDAAQANYWGPVPYTIEKVRFHAGDVVGPNLNINSTDAGRIQQNFVNGTAFDKNPWSFWRKGYTILHNPVDPEPETQEYYTQVNVPVGLDADADLYGLVTGDFNRSYDPSAVKMASASLTLMHQGHRLIAANQEFVLPIRTINDAQIGAVSLILDFPADLVEVQGISLASTNGILKWAVTDDEIRISWLSPVPLNLGAGDELVTLSLKTKDTFTAGNTIRIKLESSPLNELADEMYDVIGDAVISANVIEATAIGISENNDTQAMTLNSYPNPFKNFTVITYSLPFEGQVSLEVYNMLGNKISVLVDEQQLSGDHALKFDTVHLPGGVFMATLRLRSSENELIRTIKLINNN